VYLVVRGSEASPDILVIQYLYFEAEVLLQVFDDHHQERQLDAQGLGRVSWTGDVCRADVAAHNLQDAGLDIAVCDTFDVTIANCKRSLSSFNSVKRHFLQKQPP